jgi:hypothetical protein
VATIAIAGGIALALRGHALSVAVVVAALALVVPIVWTIVSALRPALPDRACPRCRSEALVVFEPGNKVGVRCLACGFTDPELYVPFLIDIMDDPAVWKVPTRPE